jgi:hypothetical protein
MCLLVCTTFLKGNEGQKKVLTWYVVSGAYLEKRSTDFNHISYTWSPHALDVPFGMHNLLEGQPRSKEGYNLSCRFRSISRKPPDGSQPYYTHMFPFWGVRPSEGQKKVEEGCNLSCSFRSISRKPSNGFQPYYIHMIPTCPRCAFWGVRPSWKTTKFKRRSKEGRRRL